MPDEQPKSHGHSSRTNVINAVLCAVVMFPSVFFCYISFSGCGEPSTFASPGTVLDTSGHHVSERLVSTIWNAPSIRDGLCAVTVLHPLFTLNILFFLNVCVLFWIINVVQRSTWLIDPYWTILPVLIAHYYAAHPAAHGDFTRVTLSLFVLYIWSARLTHSYFRREEWKFGVREDWRFEKKREEMPRHFWWFSFFYAFVSQMPMLVGITLPFYTISHGEHASVPWGVADVVITYIALAGIMTAYFADNQLSNFMAANRRRKEQGKPKVQLLNFGLWYYSRHPNYFGEQLFWWSMAAYAWRMGVWWPTVGTIINSATLAVVTVMTEKKMMADPARAKQFEQYQHTTSVLIPWFKFAK